MSTLLACREGWASLVDRWAELASDGVDAGARAWDTCASLSARHGPATDAQRVWLSPGQTSCLPVLVRLSPAACYTMALPGGAPHPGDPLPMVPSKLCGELFVFCLNKIPLETTLFRLW